MGNSVLSEDENPSGRDAKRLDAKHDSRFSGSAGKRSRINRFHPLWPVLTLSTENLRGYARPDNSKHLPALGQLSYPLPYPLQNNLLH